MWEDKSLYGDPGDRDRAGGIVEGDRGPGDRQARAQDWDGCFLLLVLSAVGIFIAAVLLVAAGVLW